MRGSGEGVGSIPDWGAKIPHASQCDQKKKKVPAFPSSNRNECRRKVTEPMSFLATTDNPCPSESMSKQAVDNLAMSSLGCLEKLWMPHLFL